MLSVLILRQGAADSGSPRRMPRTTLKETEAVALGPSFQTQQDHRDLFDVHLVYFIWRGGEESLAYKNKTFGNHPVGELPWG